MKRNFRHRGRLAEALAMYDTSAEDDPSFNDVYGEEGLPLEDDLVDSDSVTLTLTPEQADAIKAIAAMLPGVERNPVSVPGADLDDPTPIMERARRAYRRRGL